MWFSYFTIQCILFPLLGTNSVEELTVSRIPYTTIQKVRVIQKCKGCLSMFMISCGHSVHFQVFSGRSIQIQGAGVKGNRVHLTFEVLFKLPRFGVAKLDRLDGGAF